MIQIREVVLVLRIFKSGKFFLAHPVYKANTKNKKGFESYKTKTRTRISRKVGVF